MHLRYSTNGWKTISENTAVDIKKKRTLSFEVTSEEVHDLRSNHSSLSIICSIGCDYILITCAQYELERRIRRIRLIRNIH